MKYQKKWYNINADLPSEIPPPKNSEGKNQIEYLPKIFFQKEFLNKNFQQKDILISQMK